ncbi:Npun_F5749 family FMN-dependent PPOX-type flavoprotein [Tumidithrix elongata RA019]|uniref:Npun_F5749 family FMN-dependent PPOX-type flavoprotein n=1 Tax=Tumidithrix elongata BACA0141 TaxID=2716417 RepID=A0AAW9Q260_9CYAN|nr:Npun_F5749 family FMN-dependent PPOX-type flavoprotein [Tumidithrix elongata RA019]
MELAPWRSLLDRNLDLHQNQPEARFLQLATIDLDGYPANRTVVFRGFLPDTNHLKFVCDRRSPKIQQIALNPLAEACWYFPKTREQFRLRGKLRAIDHASKSDLQTARQIAWQELSDAGRVQFGWPHSRQPRVSDPAAFLPLPPSPETPLDTFCLLLLDPIQIDRLELYGEPQNRSIYVCEIRDRQQVWSVQAVNP